MKLKVQAGETKVSGRWNQSFKQEKQKFQAGETKDTLWFNVFSWPL